jgi:hypothetical protein
MKLNLEQIVVLANTPEWPVPKSEIVISCLQDINKEWREVLRIIDQLVTCRYIERLSGMYNIRPEGMKALEQGFDNLKVTGKRVRQLIRARE